MREDKEQRQRPEQYPKPSPTDQQMKIQDEFIDQQSSHRDEEVPMRTENVPNRLRTNEDEQPER